MIKPLPAGIARSNAHKSASRSVSARDGHAFADAMSKPLQREFDAKHHRHTEPTSEPEPTLDPTSEPEPTLDPTSESADTGRDTENIAQDVIEKNLQNGHHSRIDERAMGKVRTSAELDEPESKISCDTHTVTTAQPTITSQLSSMSVSAVRAGTGSTENVVRVDELSGLMSRLSGQSPLSVQHSNTNSPVGTSRAEGLPATLKTPMQVATGEWTVQLVDQSQAVKSIRLQLNPQGQWHIAVDMHMRTSSRPSGAIAQDLQTRLARSGHRINTLTIHDSADESDAFND